MTRKFDTGVRFPLLPYPVVEKAYPVVENWTFHDGQGLLAMLNHWRRDVSALGVTNLAGLD